ncbi:hypothetical protein H4219_002584, partial [Mycoemilia scoparia]
AIPMPISPKALEAPGKVHFDANYSSAGDVDDSSLRKRRVSFNLQNNDVVYIPSNKTIKQMVKARESGAAQQPALKGKKGSSQPQLDPELLDPSVPITGLFMRRGSLCLVSSPHSPPTPISGPEAPSSSPLHSPTSPGPFGAIKGVLKKSKNNDNQATTEAPGEDFLAIDSPLALCPGLVPDHSSDESDDYASDELLDYNRLYEYSFPPTQKLDPKSLKRKDKLSKMHRLRKKTNIFR